jgi:Zn-finger protein
MVEIKKLQDWEKQHWQWMSEELKELGIAITLDNVSIIIEVMDSTERMKRHPERCTNWRCHKQLEEINCFFCACPHYDNSKEKGGCKINSKRGFFYKSLKDQTEVIWDCNTCTAYHGRISASNYLRKNFSRIKDLIVQASSKPLNITQPKDL